MKQKLREIWGKTDDIIVRYPLVLTMALIGALSVVTAIDLEGPTNPFAIIRLIIVSLLGISVMFAIKMLSQRIGKGFLLEVIGVLFLAGYYFILPSTEKEFTEVYAYLLIPTYILSHLLVSFIPYLVKNREMRFWQYNKNLFINIFLTAVFTGVLVGGVMLAILAVDKLFDLNFDDKLYPKTFFFLAIFGSCLIFLLFNDRGLPQLEQDGSYPQILKFFTQFVLIPLLIIYSVILYFYSVKILINWELPRGWVSYLILAYSVVGILALLLVHPLKGDNTKSWVKLFSRIFYFTLIPLLVLLFVAINTRILEYGYTEPRYFVLLLALWLSSVVLYFIVVKNATIKFIPVSLFVFGLFALIFPYFNAFSVAKRSQKGELEKVLNQNQLLENGKINFTKKVSDTVADEVADKFNFLAERKEQEFLIKYLNNTQKTDFQKEFSDSRYPNVTGVIRGYFKNTVNTKNASLWMNRLELVPKNSAVSVEGYDYVAKINLLNEAATINGDQFTIENKLGAKNPTLKIILNESASADFAPYILQTLKKYESRTGKIVVDDLSSEATIGKYQVKIVFENLVQENFQQKNRYYNDAFIMIREN